MAKIVLHTEQKDIKDIHVIFIHGLGGSANSTWLERENKQDAWPLWLTEDCHALNIWSVEYSAPKFTFNGTGMGIPDLATNIFEHILKTPELADGEIIFVCHSLGGLITKQILRIASDQTKRVVAQQFISRVSGVAFLSTPHLGADTASLGHKLIPRVLLRCTTLMKPSIAAASLSRNDQNLRELNTWYRDWVLDRPIRHLVLTETEKMYGLIEVVKPDSADPGLAGIRAIPIAASHENICKPVNKDDDIYIHIRDFITQKKRELHELWLTSRFQNDVNSWEGYGNWARCPGGTSELYLSDDEIRLVDSSAKNCEGSTGLDGLNIIRDKLQIEKASIRLVGLSGVGKTRFVQALFDERIGENCLSPKAVFYTDMANGPAPTPRALAEKLVEEGRSAYLIVDNCPPEIHRVLTSICTNESSNVSLLTIEYDIREDQPEQTEVYSLEPSSPTLIEKILNVRYCYLGQQNARAISEFSGGNARIAVALAETISIDENISSLKDEELFKRLFNQRHEQEKSLEKIAQALSLVYSFQFSSDNAYSDDLQFISKLSNIPPQDLYEGASEIKRRKLIQQRSVWMAVLPHPIANRLAKYALQNINTNLVIEAFDDATDERLLKSFSRRLGYLPNCDEVRVIINYWLGGNGLIEKLHSSNKSELAWTLITNIAPVAVDTVLQHIQKLAREPGFATRKNRLFITITRLLRSLAYESQYFTQCATLLSEFALNESKGENNNSIRSILKSLFQLYLSGTHATKEQRLEVIDSLAINAGEKNQELAIELLDSSLEAWHFSSSHNFDFGANSRDFGYRPITNQDVENWYRLFINYTAKLIASDSQISIAAKATLGKNLRSLWSIRGLRDLIEKVCINISKSGMWSDGFESIHSILKFDCKTANEKEIQRLKTIADQLSPKSLLDDINMYVLAEKWKFYDLEENDGNDQVIERGYKKGQEYSRELGIKLATSDEQGLIDLLPTLLSYRGTSSNIFEFGVGCAGSHKNNQELLSLTTKALERVTLSERNIDFLCGQICFLSKHDIELTNSLLDDLIKHPELKQYLILIQLSYAIDNEAIERIIRALHEDVSPTWMYSNLANGRRHEPIPDDKLCKILDLLWQKEHGQEIVIDILSMRFHGLKQNEGYIPSTLLKDRAAFLLATFDYSKIEDHSGVKDHNFTQVANVCFSKGANKEHALSIFKKIKKSISDHIIGRCDLPEYLSVMMQMHPITALDVFITDGEEVSCQIKNALRGRFDKKISPFSKVDVTSSLDWCNKKPGERYPKLASMITTYQTVEEKIDWTPLAMELLESCPAPVKVLDEYYSNLHPNSWRGSRAKILESRLPLFDLLMSHSNNQVAAWATDTKVKWQGFIDREFAKEAEYDKETGEQFEW